MNALYPALLLALVAAPFVNAHSPEGTPKDYCEPFSDWQVHDYGPGAVGTFAFSPTDGNLAGDCDGNGIPADADGHFEFATGGGWLMVETGDGVTSGTLACYGALGHHPYFGPINVFDIALGSSIAFTVGVDIAGGTIVGSGAACGDGVIDISVSCVGSCTVTFPPGLDGTYYVFVGNSNTGSAGTQGHIFSP